MFRSILFSNLYISVSKQHNECEVRYKDDLPLVRKRTDSTCQGRTFCGEPPRRGSRTSAHGHRKPSFISLGESIAIGAPPPRLAHLFATTSATHQGAPHNERPRLRPAHPGLLPPSNRPASRAIHLQKMPARLVATARPGRGRRDHRFASTHEHIRPLLRAYPHVRPARLRPLQVRPPGQASPAAQRPAAVAAAR